VIPRNVGFYLAGGLGIAMAIGIVTENRVMMALCLVGIFVVAFGSERS
jgi:hypothetical protein